MSREDETKEKDGLFKRRYKKKIEVIERNVELSDEEKLEALEKLLSKMQKVYEKTDVDVEPSKFTAIIMFALGASSASDMYQKLVGNEAFQNYSDFEQFLSGAGSLIGSAAVGVLTILAASLAIMPIHFLKEKLAEKKCDSLYEIIEQLKIIIIEYRAKISEQSKQN